MAVIGIDLGTTNSLASVWKDSRPVIIRNSLGSILTPSVVGVDEDNNVVVGEVARERLISHPEMTASEFKRSMGTKKTFSLGENTFTPEQLSSLALNKIKDDAEAFLGHAGKKQGCFAAVAGDDDVPDAVPGRGLSGEADGFFSAGWTLGCRWHDLLLGKWG